MISNLNKNYPLIAEWVLNGQLSPDQIAKHMEDNNFAAWFAEHRPEYKT